MYLRTAQCQRQRGKGRPANVRLLHQLCGLRFRESQQTTRNLQTKCSHNITHSQSTCRTASLDTRICHRRVSSYSFIAAAAVVSALTSPASSTSNISGTSRTCSSQHNKQMKRECEICVPELRACCLVERCLQAKSQRTELPHRPATQVQSSFHNTRTCELQQAISKFGQKRLVRCSRRKSGQSTQALHIIAP